MEHAEDLIKKKFKWSQYGKEHQSREQTSNKKKIIHYVKPKKSSGYDEITSEILKACASLISHPLSYIYSHSLYTGIFPGHLTVTVGKQVHKKGDKTSMTNYRLISLLMVHSKVVEKSVHSRLSQHLHTHSSTIL
jgi:hypothetical protein